jgi:hypothetical protein
MLKLEVSYLGDHTMNIKSVIKEVKQFVGLIDYPSTIRSRGKVPKYLTDKDINETIENYPFFIAGWFSKPGHKAGFYLVPILYKQSKVV